MGIFIFDEVEVLDFAGPFEVFSRVRLEPGASSRRSEDSAPCEVFTVAQEMRIIRATGNLQVTPHFDFSSAPRPDLILVPGGIGTRALLHQESVISWLQGMARERIRLASVCTGALLLAQAGLLRGQRATTHSSAHDLLQEIDLSIVLERKERVVDSEIFTSAGVASGIDLALAIVEAWFGRAVADETACYIEFPRTRFSLTHGPAEPSLPRKEKSEATAPTMRRG